MAKCNIDMTEYRCIKETERRLYRIPALLARVEYNTSELEELISLPPHLYGTSSRSIMLAVRPGMHIEPEIAHNAQIDTIKAYIQADKNELKRLRYALGIVKDDEYFFAIDMRYLRGKKDWDIAHEKCCGQSTLRRNRLRLLRKITAFLYGEHLHKQNTHSIF